MGTYKEQNYETKSMISASLKKLMKTKPFNKITVKQIIDDCGIVRNTFYYHFEDTTDLLRWTLREDALKKIPSIENNKDLGLVIDGFCSFVLDNRSLMLSIADSLSYYDLKSVFYKDLFSIIEQNINDAINAHSLTISNDFRQFFEDICCSALAPIFFDLLQAPNDTIVNKRISYAKALLLESIRSTLIYASNAKL